MNFLSHHAVARRWAADAGDADPADEFFIGNVLPDLVSTSGAGKVRDHAIVALSGADADTPLMRGVRLHLAADRRFHGLPAFAAAQAEAKTALQSAPFAAPPRRLFFLAHAAAEIGLDGLILREDGVGIADDFYGRFDRADLPAIARAAAGLLGEKGGDDAEGAADAILRTLLGFAAHRYLYRYIDGEGQAEALLRVSRRAALPGFADEDRAALAAAFDALTPRLAPHRDALLAPPAAF